MCDRMFPKEIDQVEKYVGGLPDMIHGSVMATKPKTMQDAIEFATELMDKKINTWAEHQADNKRKSDETARNNQTRDKTLEELMPQEMLKGDHTKGLDLWAFQEGLSEIAEQQQQERDHTEGPRPLVSPNVTFTMRSFLCAPKCHKCNRFGHLGRDCKNPLNVNTGANQRACFECGAQGHFKKDCPKWKNNNNWGNQAGNAKAQAKVYAVGNAGANRTNMCHDLENCLKAEEFTPSSQVWEFWISRVHSSVRDWTVEYTNLALPEGSEAFITYCVASKMALGAVLMQRRKEIIDTLRCSRITKVYNTILDLREIKYEASRWSKLLSDYDGRKFIITQGRKANLDEARKPERVENPENIKKEYVGGILVENSKDPLKT
ncbi:putative reverse transcriptase domain-containing protein [Tanacetum coccineum]